MGRWEEKEIDESYFERLTASENFEENWKL